ncbi:MAG: nucleoside-diphosphate kinase [Acidobacteria bacterium]|nr:MAG: nucleoside-diphosphate kinase [Acidobacteriota bacterium]
MEKTLILVKPDGVRRNLIGEIISRFERRGFSIADLRMLTVNEEMASRHYAEHVDKPFFGELVEFITSGPTVAMVVEGPDAIRVARTMMGATNPADAAPGTIRGDLASAMPDNVIHGSDSPESATREIDIFFG